MKISNCCLAPQANSPTKVLNDAIDLVDHQLSINGVKIFREIPEGFPDIMINANQVEQVLMNLMLNAQHAMEDCPNHNLTLR